MLEPVFAMLIMYETILTALTKNGMDDESFYFEVCSLIRGAGDEVLCRGSGPRIWGMHEWVPEKLFLPLLPSWAAKEVKSNPPLLTSVLIVNIIKTYLRACRLQTIVIEKLLPS
jgi:hypothetical protein